MAAKKKDPDAVLDYGFDWNAATPGPWLNDGDTIADSEWFIASPANTDDDPDYLVIDSDSKTDTTTTVWLSKGVTGVTYSVTNRVTTAAGRIDDRTMTIEIKEK